MVLFVPGCHGEPAAEVSSAARYPKTLAEPLPEGMVPRAVVAGMPKMAVVPDAVPVPSGQGPVRCTLRVTVDARGRPVHAEAATCEAPYAASAIDAAERSTWYGQGEPVVFEQVYTFPHPPPPERGLLQ